ncbi:hypothetical protein [Hymenobacter coccineus]|uniref:hypothetical protein n=1 Tax=Hymenobacter coccineus TaxID=1908235 RepID=UPI000A609CF0|nr:hypothetical protein [Hymenobacter coccineus]
MPTDSSLAIYCPRCHWEPDGGAHWQCTCGCVWNTFETAAVCPRCQRRWRDTDCRRCPAAAGLRRRTRIGTTAWMRQWPS